MNNKILQLQLPEDSFPAASGMWARRRGLGWPAFEPRTKGHVPADGAGKGRSGHHSKGGTRPPPTFIHSSVRWFLQVHNGPTLPSASIPVAPCTRDSVFPHPSLEQMPIRSVDSPYTRSCAEVMDFRLNLSNQKITAVSERSVRISASSRPGARDRSDREAGNFEEPGHGNRSTSVTSRGGTWPGPDREDATSKCPASNVPRAV
jgi:hypothetical protein